MNKKMRLISKGHCLLASIAIFIMCVLALHSTIAQEVGTQAESVRPKLFQGASGSATIIGSEEIAVVKGSGDITINAQELIDGATDKRETGILIEIHQINSGITGAECWSNVFVEYGEIDSLIKGIDYVTEADGSATKLAHFEITYSTKNGLALQKSNTWKDSFSKLNDQTKIAITHGAEAWFEAKDLRAFKDAITKAKARLDSLKKTDAKEKVGS